MPEWREFHTEGTATMKPREAKIVYSLFRNIHNFAYLRKTEDNVRLKAIFILYRETLPVQKLFYDFP